MKKIIILICLLLLLCGCNATYNIEINNDKKSKEELIIENIEDYYSLESIDDLVNDSFLIPDHVDYSIEGSNLIVNRSLNNYINLNDNYEIKNNFGELKVNSKRISFIPDYDKCIFLFSDGGEYISNDELIINVNIPFKVSKSNATSVQDNIYTWKYNINNCNNELYIEMSNNSSVLLRVIIILVVVILAVLVILKLKKNEN